MHSSMVCRAGALAALALGSVALVASDAHAVGTRTFVLDTLDKLSGGDLSGVAISSDGTVRAGWTLGSIAIPDAAATFSALSLADGRVLVGTSPNGKIYEASGGGMTLFADTGALAVTSIVEAKGGALYAATIPDGKIFRITKGKADLFATLPGGGYVWALVVDRAGTGLFAATGPEGKVFHVDAGGQSTVHYRSADSQVVSLAMDAQGALLAGTSGKGLVLRIEGPGRARVLAKLPGDEVKALAVSRGYVWAISNDYGELPEPPKRPANAGHAPAGPTTQAKTKPGKGALVRIDATGRTETMMKHDDTHYVSMVLDEDGHPFVGTGAEGRVYTVDDAHATTLVADTDERQVGALGVARGKGFVATTDPPVFHAITGHGGPEAIWTSKPLDAGLAATFGRLTWRSTGALELSTRVGNSATPDDTWTSWSNGTTTPVAIGGTGSRYVQVRARWSKDPNAILHEVTLPFLTENLRPIVTEVKLVPKGAPTKETGSGIPASGASTPKHDSVIKVTWKVDNPDNDELRYRVAFRREGQDLWMSALTSDDVLTKAELEWDTAALGEGKYRLRVEASDELANPPSRALKHELVSDVVLVDNTPPRIENVQLSGRKLHVRAIDGTTAIARVEIAVDGRVDWIPLAAADGIFDSPDESVDADVSSLVGPGRHLVLVRVFDVAGNSVTRDIEAR